MINIGKLLAKQKSAATDVHAAIGEIREQITLLSDQRQQVEALPLPLDQAMAACDLWLDGLEGRSIRASAFTTGDRLDWPRCDMSEHSSLPGLLAAACRDLIRACVERELLDLLEGRETATPEQKAERMAALDAELDNLERAEEAAIRQAEAAGIAILRRREARPAIVLLPDGEI